MLHICSGNEGVFVSCGEKHVSIWSHQKGGLVQTTVSLGKHKNKSLMCAAQISKDNKFIIGTSEGDLLVINHSSGSGSPVVSDVKEDGKEINLKTAINAIWSDFSDGFLLTGGKDGKVIAWDKLSETSLQRNIRQLNSGTTSAPVRSICKTNRGVVLVGTQTCDIFEYSSTGNDSRHLVSGHFKDELWGLAVRPPSSLANTEEYCTTGDDGFLRVWNLKTHKEVFAKNLDGISRACSFSPDGTALAVGFGSGGRGKHKEDGLVKVFRLIERDGATTDIETIAEIKEAKQWISVVKFSPDGLTLAVGSRDNSIYLYSVTQKYKKKAKFSKHKAGINHIDFSSCSKYIQSCCRLTFKNSITSIYHSLVVMRSFSPTRPMQRKSQTVPLSC